MLGITGTGGRANRRWWTRSCAASCSDFPEKTIGIISVDPPSARPAAPAGRPHPHERHPRPEGVHAFAGHAPVRTWPLTPCAKMRSILQAAGYDLIILETSGIGQSDTEIVDHGDVSMYVMTRNTAPPPSWKRSTCWISPNYRRSTSSTSAAPGCPARRAQAVARNHLAFDIEDDDVPVFGTIASQFNDPGVNWLFVNLIRSSTKDWACPGRRLDTRPRHARRMTGTTYIIPPQPHPLPVRDLRDRQGYQRRHRAAGRARDAGAALLRAPARPRRSGTPAPLILYPTTLRTKGSGHLHRMDLDRCDICASAIRREPLPNSTAEAIDILRDLAEAQGRNLHATEQYIYQVRGQARSAVTTTRESLQPHADSQDRAAAVQRLGRICCRT